MERLLYSGNLLRAACAHAGGLQTPSGKMLLRYGEPTWTLRPAELSVRYSVGVTLQVFLKTLQK
jgi:hypothetical protein